MRTLVAGLVLVATAGACAPDPRMPESSYQWERRQERIEREWRASQAKAPAAVQSAPGQTSTNGAAAPEDRF